MLWQAAAFITNCSWKVSCPDPGLRSNGAFSGQNGGHLDVRSCPIHVQRHISNRELPASTARKPHHRVRPASEAASTTCHNTLYAPSGLRAVVRNPGQELEHFRWRCLVLSNFGARALCPRSFWRTVALRETILSQRYCDGNAPLRWMMRKYYQL
jgi:hypothetical protein